MVPPNKLSLDSDLVMVFDATSKSPHATRQEKPKGTIIGCLYEGGAVIAAGSRSECFANTSDAYYVDGCKKLFLVCPTIIVGCVGNTEDMEDIQLEIRIFARRFLRDNKRWPTVEEVATKCLLISRAFKFNDSILELTFIGLWLVGFQCFIVTKQKLDNPTMHSVLDFSVSGSSKTVVTEFLKKGYNGGHISGSIAIDLVVKGLEKAVNKDSNYLEPVYVMHSSGGEWVQIETEMQDGQWTYDSFDLEH